MEHTDQLTLLLLWNFEAGAGGFHEEVHNAVNDGRLCSTPLNVQHFTNLLQAWDRHPARGK